VRDDCERFHVASLLRPDGELPALERQLQEAHLARCGECRAYASEIARITACIRATPPLRLERRVVVRHRSLRDSLVRAGAAVGIAAVIAAGIGQAKRSATATPQPPAAPGAAGVRKAL
jgi:predicted anti-sigma-YlaC factor YlaD